jgi:hypothetical protein
MAPKVDRNRTVENPNLDRTQTVGRPATPPAGGEAAGPASTGFSRDSGGFAKYASRGGRVGRGVFSPQVNTYSVPGLPPGLTFDQVTERLSEHELSTAQLQAAYQARLG